MKSRLNRKLIVLLLTAGILFGSLTPPAVLHAHDNGHQTHDHHSKHDRDASRDHQHGHSHDHGQSHNHAERPTPQKATSHSAHLHVTLFGLEFSLPDGQTPCEDDADGPESPTLFHWLDCEFNVGSTTEIDFLVNHLLLLASADDIERTDVIACPQTAQAMLASLPLCDSARCERSGVLLI